MALVGEGKITKKHQLTDSTWQWLGSSVKELASLYPKLIQKDALLTKGMAWRQTARINAITDDDTR